MQIHVTNVRTSKGNISVSNCGKALAASSWCCPPQAGWHTESFSTSKEGFLKGILFSTSLHIIDTKIKMS